MKAKYKDTSAIFYGSYRLERRDADLQGDIVGY